MTPGEGARDPRAEVVVVATAVINGLGYSPHQVWAMRRAEQAALVESPFVLPDGTRATMAVVRSLPPRSHGEARIAAMSARLLDEALPTIAELGRVGARVGVWSCLPERWSVGDAATLRAARQAWDVASSVGLSADVHTVCEGHSSAARAARDAGRALCSGRLDVAVILAVDTYYDPAAIARLLAEGRIYDGENLDGTVPGEGGALLVLSRRDVASRVACRPRAVLRAAAVVEEPAPFGSEAPCAARGSTAAAHAVTASLRRDREPLDWWLTDVTGEEHRQHELGLVVPRVAEGLASPAFAVEATAVHLGDLGAASMATAMVIATEAFGRGGPRASNCLITGASDGPMRGAVLLSA